MQDQAKSERLLTLRRSDKEFSRRYIYFQLKASETLLNKEYQGHSSTSTYHFLLIILNQLFSLTFPPKRFHSNNAKSGF